MLGRHFVLSNSLPELTRLRIAPDNQRWFMAKYRLGSRKIQTTFGRERIVTLETSLGQNGRDKILK